MSRVSEWLAKTGRCPRLYRAWSGMRERCSPKSSKARYYAMRGITVCERWDDFSAFAADMGPHPGAGWTLDRIDNNKGYSLGNCRWATITTQNRNKRTARLTAEDVEQIRKRHLRVHPRKSNTSELALEFGVDTRTIRRVVAGETWNVTRQ